MRFSSWTLGPWSKRLALILLGTLAALLVCEVSLRLGRTVSPRLRGLLYTPTAATEFDHLKTTQELLEASYFGYHPLGATRGFRLNSRGFRTSEYTTEKSPGSFRVIALGDSFTFDSSSVPYAWMWHQRTGRLLAQATGRPVEVLSLSVPAVGPRFLLRLWELEGRSLNSDLVVLAFFVGNDFTDEAGTPLGETRSGVIARWSLTWRLLRNVSRLRLGLDASRGDDASASSPTPGKERPGRLTGGVESPDYIDRYDAETPTLKEDQYLRIERQRLRVLAGPDADRFQGLCDAAVRVVERLGRDVEARGSQFVVLIIPDEAQVDPKLRERLFPESVLSALDLDRAQECLRRQLDDMRIHNVDLLPVFRTATAQGRLYRPQDTHWNAAGNRLASRVLADYLLKKNRPPG